MDLRRATHDDAAPIATLLEAAFVPFRPQYTDGCYDATIMDAERIDARIRSGAGIVWVVERDGRVVGTVSALTQDDGCYLRSLAAHPDARGAGVGEALMRTVEDYAHQAGAARVYLSTTPFLDAAIRLYEREGYVRTDAPPHDLFGTPLITFEKRLP